MPFINPYRTQGELNEIEQWKLERHPLEIADAIIDTYSKEGPASIAKVAGEVERLKWAGIYPQKQGGDAFMMRVKIPGGYLTAPQIREIGVVADAFGEGPDGTEPSFRIPLRRPHHAPDRPDPLASHRGHPPHLAPVRGRGPHHLQACGDSARNVSSCPVSGVDPNEAFDGRPVAEAVSAFFTGNREYANLPRKFKISVTGCMRGLRPGRDQRHRAVAGPGRGRHARLQRPGRWRPVRRGADGLGHRCLRAPGPGRRDHQGHRPALRRARQPGEPRAWPACATWSRSSGPRASGSSWPPGPASIWSRPGRT